MKNAIFLLLFIGAALGLLFLPKPKEQTPAMAGEPAAMGEPAVIPDDKPYLIEFYSTTCNICTQMKPILDKLEKEFGDRIAFVRVNVDNPANEELLHGFQVDGLPTMYLVRLNRTKFSAFEGFVPEKVLAENLTKMADEKQPAEK